jgi:hypothetical protein
MKIPSGGVLVPPEVCFEVGSILLDAVMERYGRDGRPVPKEVRAVGLEIWEVGRIVAARHSPSIPVTVPALVQSHSPSPDSEVMTCSTTQAATRLHLSAREVRYLRERGRLGGHVVNGRLAIPIVDVDRLVTERTTRS